MKINKLALGILAGAALVTAAAILMAKKSRSRTGEILREISDEGYETAHDILYPGQNRREKNLRYGPVLPM